MYPRRLLPHIRRSSTAVEELAHKLLRGERAALSRAITLVESTTDRHRAAAAKLMDMIATHGDGGNQSTESQEEADDIVPIRRIGIAGPPGAGKSTFIEAFGLHLLREGHRVAVLAVDPSSTRSGGSILGDKTRMTELSVHPLAYVRPSPTRGTLGGVCLGTHEAIQLCEAGGFDYVIVETVGVGQSEVEVDNMVDMLLLLVPPAGGDALQGVKRGIVEMADMIVVNKNDGELKKAVQSAVRGFRQALTLLRPKTAGWQPPVHRCSALEKEGLEEVASEIERFYETAGKSEIPRKRQKQTERWIWMQLHSQLWTEMTRNEQMQKQVAEMTPRINNRNMSARAVTQGLLKHWTFSSAE